MEEKEREGGKEEKFYLRECYFPFINSLSKNE